MVPINAFLALQGLSISVPKNENLADARYCRMLEFPGNPDAKTPLQNATANGRKNEKRNNFNRL
jgi:hypothetical protein